MKLWLALLLVAVMVVPCAAGTVTLKWGLNPEGDQVTKYNVYVDDVKTASVAGNVDTASQQVTNGSHKFNVTAENGWGESSKSNSVYTPPLLSNSPTLQVLTIVVTPGT